MGISASGEMENFVINNLLLNRLWFFIFLTTINKSVNIFLLWMHK